MRGIKCQAWNVDKPHNTNKTGAGLGSHNYCRNPDGKKGVWCFTTNKNITWDYCPVRQCRENCDMSCGFLDFDCQKVHGLGTKTGMTYQGTMNQTETGKPCQM